MEKLNFPSPKPLYFDGSCTICNSPYIFINFISYLQSTITKKIEITMK